MLFTVNDGIPAPIKYLFGGNERTSQVIWKGKVHRFRFIITAIKGDWPFLRSACGLANGFNCTDKCHRCMLPDSWYYILGNIFVPNLKGDLSN